MPSFGIDDPAVGDCFAARDRELDLAGGHRRGRHIQIKRRFEIGRHRDRNRIGAEPRLAAAERRDMFGRTAGIGRGDPDHAFAHRHHRIGGEPADMALPEHGARRDIGGLRLLDRQRHRLGVDMEAEPPMAVDHGRGRRFLHDGPLRAGHDMSGLDAVDIGRNRDDAVRVMAGEIGVDAADGDRAGFLVRGAGGLEQCRTDAREAVGLDNGHGISSFDARAGRGSCLLFVLFRHHGLKAMAPEQVAKIEWPVAAKHGRARQFPHRGIEHCRRKATRCASPTVWRRWRRRTSLDVTWAFAPAGYP